MELGCGTGQILLALARLGLRVAGLDVSQAMLDKCQRKLDVEPEEVRRRVSVYHGDMREFELPERFAGIFLPYHAVFHLLSAAALEACFSRILRHLLPGGEFICDLFFPDPAYLSQFTRQRGGMRLIGRTQTPRGIYQVSEHVSYDAVSQRMLTTFRYELLNEDHCVEATWYRTLDYRVAAPEELRLHLLRCGFETVNMWGAFDRQTVLEPTRDLVIQARKK